MPVLKDQIRISKGELRYLYLEKKLSGREIAKEFDCGKTTILKQLYQYNIPVRKAKMRIDVPKNRLEDLYVNKKLSMDKIVKIFNTNSATIHNRLHEHRVPVRSLSEALKGRIPWNKGKHLSDETKRKIGRISKEFWNSPENKEKIKIRNKKISKAMKGGKNPMKRPEARKKRSEKMKGKLVGNKNPAKKPEIRRKISKALKGHTFSLETRKKISKTLNGRYKGKDNPFYGKHHTEKVKEKSRIRAIRQMTSGEIGKRNTSIELIVEKELRKRDIYYKKQIPLMNITVVDFYLPQHRIAIYTDGSFWHRSKWAEKQGVIEKDRKQNKILTANGYKVFRFSETEINSSAERCVNKIVKFINKI